MEMSQSKPSMETETTTKNFSTGLTEKSTGFALDVQPNIKVQDDFYSTSASATAEKVIDPNMATSLGLDSTLISSSSSSPEFGESATIEMDNDDELGQQKFTFMIGNKSISFSDLSEEDICLHVLQDRDPIHEIFEHADNVTNSTSIFDYESEVIRNCPRHWDGIRCWPPTPEGSIATVFCFEDFNGVKYDGSINVSRPCGPGGIWQPKTDYSSCIAQQTSTEHDDENMLGITTHIYLFGYCLSLAALILAILIFLAFNCVMSWHSRQTCGGQVGMNKSCIVIQARELRCLRNKIHTQLMTTYTLAAVLWVIVHFTTTAPSQVSCTAFLLLHYFHLTSFFWMFVEGLYLYVLVVQTFQTQTDIKLRVYTAIGWGLPLLVVIAWSIVKWQTHPESFSSGHGDFKMPCGILAENHYDWIYKAPALVIICVNVVFLLRIMWVLITKLRSSTNPETNQSRKTAKAFVVLVPLLGVTFIFILAGPRSIPAYEHFRALLISMQGFLVALFYCFLNGEVKSAVRHRWNRLNCCGPCQRCCCYCCPGGRRRHLQQVHEWSSRSRTESIRLYTPASNPFRKRESTASESTTMTSLHSGGSSLFNGAHQPLPAGPTKLLSLQSNSLLNPKVENNSGDRKKNYII